MNLTLSTFPSWHAAFGELIESSSSESQAVNKIARELGNSTEAMVRALLLSFQFYHGVTKHRLKHWSSQGFKLSQGEVALIKKAGVSALQKLGASVANFTTVVPRHNRDSYSDNDELMLRTTFSFNIFKALDKGVLMELADLSPLHNTLVTSEKALGLDTLFKPTSELIAQIAPENQEMFNEASTAITSHLTCFMQGTYQVRLRHIRAMLADSVLSDRRAQCLYMTDSDLAVRVMHLIGYIDSTIDALNDRTSSVKSLMGRNPTAKDIRSIIRGNCATARSHLTVIRSELKDMMLIYHAQMNVRRRFPEFFKTITEIRTAGPDK